MTTFCMSSKLDQQTSSTGMEVKELWFWKGDLNLR